MVLAGLGNESFVVSAGRAGIPAGVFVVAGGAESQRGDGFAVYELLRTMGCSFLAFDQTVEEQLGPALYWRTRTRPVALPATLDLTFHPVLDYRDTNEWAAAGSPGAHGNFSAALGYNGPNTPIPGASGQPHARRPAAAAAAAAAPLHLRT